ncbi:MAG: D-Ala-D-Ala carboxypeptidase family metallohydrolase [Verrucomicrobiota bacterium]
MIEFACRDGSDEVVLHDAVLQGLEWIRWYFGKPIIVSSGYRTDAYNRQVGGRPNSRHLYGLAADIIVIGIQPHRVAEYAERLEFGGVGRYPGKGFTHVDVYGYRRRWRR